MRPSGTFPKSNRTSQPPPRRSFVGCRSGRFGEIARDRRLVGRCRARAISVSRCRLLPASTPVRRHSPSTFAGSSGIGNDIPRRFLPTADCRGGGNAVRGRRVAVVFVVPTFVVGLRRGKHAVFGTPPRAVPPLRSVRVFSARSPSSTLDAITFVHVVFNASTVIIAIARDRSKYPKRQH